MFFGHLRNFVLFWGIYTACPGVDQSAELQFQSLKSGSWTTFSPSPAGGTCNRFRAPRKHPVPFCQGALFYVDSINIGICVGDVVLVSIRCTQESGG